MMKLKIKTGDTVKIIAGEEKGKEGKVLRVDREKNRAIVEGLNLVKKHTKPNAQNPQGGIVEKEASIHISNLALIDPKTKKTTRVGIEERDGKKVRISKKSNVVI
ncbi:MULTISPECIES: 50S ribosomal protein L24 [Capnocytophaga]|jgi:ribosomal protein L24|uniref:Large ribosomal subunit protein uL24 n=2 Tax=Capnocytophaga TaxID=1016 RepID=C7M4S1_CAPOD|nr:MULTISPECIES: 50S ribosomal protein L24 [Capnocytophaga]ACU92711.1 ribosomal protein L24 [Capnocytophaga ochracea DSM 7271]ATA71063.1 50S ribosomal protein L24 [Capnocytophaga sputigena]ATA80027.1 50S ribosomal protein L24 [Capnocytophaga sputigena]UAK51433.1 50S ribosomal protein L24 [Capnocytophaga ochracea]VEI55486.1 50S ribosomal protein L24 [Capnocytophaga sputigena]